MQLSRKLAKLAGDFPRFKLALNRLQHHVLLQVRSPAWKARTVLKCMDQEEPISTRELVKDSGLDHQSLTATLAELQAAARVIPCNRAGRALLVGDEGRKTYWLKAEP